MLKNYILWFGFFLFLSSYADASNTLVVEHGPRSEKKIALTFDACPTGRPDEYDDKVIDVLIRENVRATLFMSGRWVEKNQEKTKLLANMPQFEIAAHSFYHPHMMEKDDARDIREFSRTQAMIRRVTGKTPRYFRPPYGEVDERVAKLARSAGLVTIQYDIASGDPDPGLSPQRLARSLLRNAKGGSIIVFHMNKNGVHTAEVLPEVIEGLRKKGFALVTVSELLREPAQNAVQAPVHKIKTSATGTGRAAPAASTSF